MKKLLIGLSVLFLISGCDNGNEKLTCTSANNANGMTSDTKYEIEYNDKDVKLVTITYDYNDDNDTSTTNNAANNNTTNNNDNTNTTNNTNTTTNTTNDNDQTDGVNADTDGLTTNNDSDNNTGNSNSDEVLDGAVGNAIDGVVDGVTGTILDIAGIKNRYENQLSAYDNIEGFTYNVDVDEDNEYKVVYKIDLDKISDTDLAKFNIDRDIDTLRTNYENQGFTCK